ncbi:hypothetical protein AMES_7211 [Amycolatopsis mediterranei S699]|uniref:Uncharacterized protein n=2 Tax=Amycolatopsis mediterranei TaxID=33910 RepID=A0A0H3DEA5_AMYMU|nr:hypothetical protein [Amycolatopsis mediterranei]ADJ49036.1 hypothetical protein AMED_7321 [Amycolatopsis mediterranei U32]AEK45992.1 hypothetical protein RAM_37625 [Amycolatopsis mediterranei S699]AFO80744.1 hypothetical protein AMES_7211 [Amycolatopsis mediterranei S699]AGT87872.1 hypothetical protein B737_7211 [Amycolatopsis mediterranei RB]KDU93842.1 hypothetical protein DV36_00440 [Amycolatopsis mediterranei]
MDVAVSSTRQVGLGEETYARHLPGSGVGAVAHYLLDRREHERRQLAELGSLDDLAALDAMLELPEEADISRESVSGRVQRIVARLPESAVSQSEDRLRRLARHPVRVERITVAVRRSWTAALQRVLEFSQFAERVLVCTSSPTHEQVLEASYNGVGVALEGDDGNWVLEPDAFVVQQHSAARWAFAERVYALHLSCSN